MANYVAVVGVPKNDYRGIHDLGKRVSTNMAENKVIFADPPVPLDTFDTSLNELGTHITNYDGSKLDYQEIMDLCGLIFKDIRKLQNYVNWTADGDRGIILKSGFDPNDERTPVTTVPAKARIQKIIDGAISGSFKVLPVVKEANNRYKVELADPENPTEYRLAKDFCNARTIEVDGCTPGKRLFVRITASNGLGWGDPSEPVEFIPR